MPVASGKLFACFGCWLLWDGVWEAMLCPSGFHPVWPHFCKDWDLYFLSFCELTAPAAVWWLLKPVLPGPHLLRTPRLPCHGAPCALYGYCFIWSLSSVWHKHSSLRSLLLHMLPWHRSPLIFLLTGHSFLVGFSDSFSFIQPLNVAFPQICSPFTDFPYVTSFGPMVSDTIYMPTTTNLTAFQQS